MIPTAWVPVGTGRCAARLPNQAPVLGSVHRLGGVMVFEALSETELVDELLDVFTSTAATLKPNCSGATP